MLSKVVISLSKDVNSTWLLSMKFSRLLLNEILPNLVNHLSHAWSLCCCAGHNGVLYTEGNLYKADMWQQCSVLIESKGVHLLRAHFRENLEREVRPVSVFDRVSVQCRFHCSYWHIGSQIKWPKFQNWADWVLPGGHAVLSYSAFEFTKWIGRKCFQSVSTARPKCSIQRKQVFSGLPFGQFVKMMFYSSKSNFHKKKSLPLLVKSCIVKI